jgi:hypothetical protein
MIKRPVLENGARLLVGFKPEIYDSALRGSRTGRPASTGND